MSKNMILLLCVVTLFGTAYGSQRTVVIEQFTATGCGYCPGAARGLEELYDRVYDSVMIIAYHVWGSDPFYTTDAATRSSYYGISGIPHVRFDGIIQTVGGLHTGTVFPTYRKNYYQRIGIGSPLEIELECTYGADKDSGVVEATVLNTSAVGIDGTLHFVIVESDIEYYWQGMNRLHFVERDMLPNANGEAVSIPSGGFITRSREFEINPSWVEDNCRIVVFVQSSAREIYQGAWTGVTEKAKMQYYGMAVIPDEQYDIFRPGDFLTAKVLAKNFGTGVYNERIIIRSEDSLLKITQLDPTGNRILPGDVDTVCTFTAYAEAVCPDPHQTELIVDFRTSEDTLPILVSTQFGLSDEVESGSAGWDHYGINDHWHITEHASYSPTHSWYCGIEGSWQYTNENDASLVTPYFVATPDTHLTFKHKYRMQYNSDYGFIEIDNGSGWWKILEIITGGDNSWEDFSYPLDEFALQTARLRYRFISGYSVTDEGWYIDDITVPVKIFSIDEDEILPASNLSIIPTLVKSHVSIWYQSTNPGCEIAIYDVSGRIVRKLKPDGGKTKWDCTDGSGNRLPGGVYFVKILSDRDCQTENLVLLR